MQCLGVPVKENTTIIVYVWDPHPIYFVYCVISMPRINEIYGAGGPEHDPKITVMTFIVPPINNLGGLEGVVWEDAEAQSSGV